MKNAIVLALVLVLAGCSKTNSCKKGTVLLEYDVSGVSIDSIQIAVSVSGRPSKTSTVMTTARSGSVEIDFPSGYPTGSRIAVTASAFENQAEVATGSAALSLGSACTVLPITLRALSAPDGGGADGGNADGGTLLDLASPDLINCMPITTCPASVACGPYPDGCNGTIQCGTCQVTAVHSHVASTGDSVTVEGTFGATATVTLPGGGMVTASPASHRVSFSVPSGATIGNLSITTGGTTVGAFPFHHTTYPIGIQQFNIQYEQSGFARQPTSLSTPRFGSATVTTSTSAYVIGGANGAVPLGTIERATINADSTLGPFSNAGALVAPRYGHSIVQTDRYVFVIGGTNGNPIGSIESAPLNSDGTLGSFATASVALTTPRANAAAVVIGNSVYVVGGVGSTALNTVERAPINADGTLGAFVLVPGVTLVNARSGHTAEVVGNWLYVLGGTSARATSVERAAINSDGTLGSFAQYGAGLVTPRNQHASITIGGNVFVVAGLTGSTTLNAVEQASVDANGDLGSFSTVNGVVLPYAAGGVAIASVGNFVYAFGGGSGPGGAVATVAHASFDAGNGFASTTKSTTVMPGIDPRYEPFPAILGKYWYRIGGNGNVTVNTAESAIVNPDGTISSFTNHPTISIQNIRDTGVSAVVGNNLYLIGGGNPNSGVSIPSVERATVNADGTISAFTTVNGVTLSTARSLMQAVVLGSNLYVIGGFTTTGNGQTANGDLSNIEHATIASDGSISTFSTTGQPSLNTPRSWFTLVVSNGWVFVIGGFNYNQNAILGSIERAPINADQTLGAFTTLSVALKDPRAVANAAVIGNSLFVVSGELSFEGGQTTTIEKATIGTDGTLGSFSVVNDSALTVGRGAFVQAVFGNVLWAVGGRESANPTIFAESGMLR